MAERAAAADNLPTISKEEKSLMGEVNESGPVAVQVVPSSANSRKPHARPRGSVEAKETKKTEESLIEF